MRVQGGSTQQALSAPRPFHKSPELHKVKTWFPPSGRRRRPAYPVEVKKNSRPSGPCGTLGVGPGAISGPGQPSAEECRRFLGQAHFWAGHSQSRFLQSRAFQRVCRSTTHKCTAFRPESGHGSCTVRKPATRYTRKWGRIPRTGKNSRRTGRVEKKYRRPTEVHLSSGSKWKLYNK